MQRPNGPDATQPGNPQIEEDNTRMEFSTDADRRFPIGRFPHHVDVVGCAHAHLQAQAHHGMIIDQYGPNGC